MLTKNSSGDFTDFVSECEDIAERKFATSFFYVACHLWRDRLITIKHNMSVSEFAIQVSLVEFINIGKLCI